MIVSVACLTCVQSWSTRSFSVPRIAWHCACGLRHSVECGDAVLCGCGQVYQPVFWRSEDGFGMILLNDLPGPVPVAKAVES